MIYKQALDSLSSSSSSTQHNLDGVFFVAVLQALNKEQEQKLHAWKLSQQVLDYALELYQNHTLSRVNEIFFCSMLEACKNLAQEEEEEEEDQDSYYNILIKIMNHAKHGGFVSRRLLSILRQCCVTMIGNSKNHHYHQQRLQHHYY